MFCIAVLMVSGVNPSIDADSLSVLRYIAFFKKSADFMQ